MKVLKQYQNMSFHTLQVCEKYLDDSYSTWIFPGVWVKVVAAESVISLIVTWTPATAHWLHEIKKKKQTTYHLKGMKIFKAHWKKVNISVASQCWTVKRQQRSLKQTALQTQDSVSPHRISKTWDIIWINMQHYQADG